MEKAEYALAVVYGIVKEVYQIDEWLLAENEVRETIPYNEAVDAGRIIFKGRTADEEIRKKYLDYSAIHLSDILLSQSHRLRLKHILPSPHWQSFSSSIPESRHTIRFGEINGRKVQIKISQQDNIVINHEPEYLIVMYLNKSGNVYEVYNGPGKEPWNNAGKRDSHNNRHIMVNNLMELDKNVASNQVTV